MILITYALYVNGRYRMTVASRVPAHAKKLALSAAIRIRKQEPGRITIK